jgi:hypothetical protein
MKRERERERERVSDVRADDEKENVSGWEKGEEKYKCSFSQRERESS